MLEFRKITIEDKAWIKELLSYSDFRGCEYNFANNLAWHRLYETSICRYKDFYIACSCKYGLHFTFPSGRGDYADVFSQLRKYAESQNKPLVITSVTPEQLPLFEELYAGQYTVSSDIADFDYVYSAEKLRTLSGKKFHGKRNHLVRFKENNYSFEKMTENNFDECIEFAVKSYNDNNAYDDESSVSEQFAINTFFNHFNELGLMGGVLKTDGKICGFTIGSRINSDTLDINVEKALPEIQGAYTAVNNEFAKLVSEGFRYINREEDLGLEGLRKSKQSYYPEFLIEKNMLTFR